MTRAGLAAALLAAIAVAALPRAAAQTPGAIPDPSTYQGSMELQRQEQLGAQQQQQQNDQMLQRLDQNYSQYAPPSAGRGAARAGPPPIDWWKKPPLPAARNPLLGRWKQVASRGVSNQQLGLAGMLPGVADVVNGGLAGGCESIFGKGVIAFEPAALQWVAPDGHEEILNHIEYRASGSEVVVITRDPGAIPALIFGFPGHDHAVVAFLNCTMDRLGAAPPRPAPASGLVAAAPSGPADAILAFNVVAGAPVAGARIWVTRHNPDEALVGAGFAPAPGARPMDRFFAECRGAPEVCVRGLKAMTTGALGSVITDAAGHAQTPHIPAGRYYLLSLIPYQDHRLVWDLPVEVRSGANSINLDQRNGAAYP